MDVEATPAANEVGGGPSSSSSTLDECAVCLTEFEEGDEVRVLPCGHIFHLDCCDKWLLGSGRGPGERRSRRSRSVRATARSCSSGRSRAVRLQDHRARAVLPGGEGVIGLSLRTDRTRARPSRSCRTAG